MSACTHGMPSPLTCVDCMNEGNLPPAPKTRPSPWSRPFEARYDGRCVLCDENIVRGDFICIRDTVGIAHDNCAEAAS